MLNDISTTKLYTIFINELKNEAIKKIIINAYSIMT